MAFQSYNEWKMNRQFGIHVVKDIGAVGSKNNHKSGSRANVGTVQRFTPNCLEMITI